MRFAFAGHVVREIRALTSAIDPAHVSSVRPGAPTSGEARRLDELDARCRPVEGVLVEERAELAS